MHKIPCTAGNYHEEKPGDSDWQRGVEANVPHRVVAKTDAVMLVTMTPSPAYHSLEREVSQGVHAPGIRV